MRISLYTVILNIFIKYYIHSTFNILMIDSNILNETDARCMNEGRATVLQNILFQRSTTVKDTARTFELITLHLRREFPSFFFLLPFFLFFSLMETRCTGF